MLRVRRLDDILSTAMRLVPDCDKNACLKSPFQTSATWKRGWETLLKAERTLERIGEDPADIFWRMINDAATGAARDGKFLRTWTESRAPLGDSCRAWLVAPPQDGFELVLTREFTANLFKRIGHASIVTSLLREHTAARNLRGKGGEVRWLGVSLLLPETQAQIQLGYEAWVAKELKRIQESQQ